MGRQRDEKSDRICSIQIAVCTVNARLNVTHWETPVAVTEHTALCPQCHELCLQTASTTANDTSEENGRLHQSQPDGVEGDMMSGTVPIPVQEDVFVPLRLNAESSQSRSAPINITPQPPRAQSRSVPPPQPAPRKDSLPSLVSSNATATSLRSAISYIPATPPDHVIVDASVRSHNGKLPQSLVARKPDLDTTADELEEQRIDAEEEYGVPNPLLEVGKIKMPSIGRGCLFPGSVFKGKQTSGRSSYEVEVRILVSLGLGAFRLSLNGLSGRLIPSLDAVRLPLHLPSNRDASTAHDILLRRDNRSQIRIRYGTCVLLCPSDGTRRHAALVAV